VTAIEGRALQSGGNAPVPWSGLQLSYCSECPGKNVSAEPTTKDGIDTDNDRRPLTFNDWLTNEVLWLPGLLVFVCESWQRAWLVSQQSITTIAPSAGKDVRLSQWFSATPYSEITTWLPSGSLMRI
jgi:hypothetical protein